MCVAVVGFLSIAAAAPQKPAPPQWAAADVLPLRCAQAWMISGKSYPRMLSIVDTLVRVPLANRGLTFPNTRDAGSGQGNIENLDRAWDGVAPKVRREAEA
jgi:hypothetical protein